MRWGSGPRSGRALAEQTQRPPAGATSAIGCCHFDKTAKRIAPFFAREISALPRGRRFGETNPMRPAAGATSAFGCCHFGRTNYPSFRSRNQRIAEGPVLAKQTQCGLPWRGRTAGRTQREGSWHSSRRAWHSCVGMPKLGQQRGNRLAEARKRCLCDFPDADMIDGRIAMDQDIAEADDLVKVRHSPRDVRKDFRQLFQASPMISNCRSTAARTSALPA